MENLFQTEAPTQGYFKYWSWILQYALAEALLKMLEHFVMITRFSTLTAVAMTALWASLRIVFWLGVGRVFNLKTPATYAVYAQIAVFVVQALHKTAFAMPYGAPDFVNLPFTLVQLCGCAPLLVFLGTAFPNQDRWILILFGVSTPLIASLWTGLSWFEYALRSFHFLELHYDRTTIFLPNYWYRFGISISQTVILGAFVSHLQAFDFNFRDKLIQLDHQYSKAQALLIYWGTKILIMSMAFDVFSDAARIAQGSMKHSSGGLILSVLIFVKTLIHLGTLYFVIQYFRKFLLEHLYSRGFTPSFNYWLFMIPILGLFAFASTLSRPFVSIPERIALFEQSPKFNKRDTLAVTIAILQLISIFWGGYNPANLLSAFISIGFFVFFVHNETALQILLGIVCLAIVYLFLGNATYQTSLIALTTLYQLVMMYLLVGIFHIGSFEYLPELEETESA
jgi:hypothetical protein